jgi:hypothetical protein
MEPKFQDKSDWAEGNQAGRAKADVLVAKIAATDSPNLLGFEVKEMIAAGVYGAVEVGFFHRLSAHLRNAP